MKLEPTAGELLGAFQLNIVSANEVRIAFGLEPNKEEEESE
jgi:hypothetical protein